MCSQGRASPAVAQQWHFASRASSGGTPQATGIGAEGGRSLLGVARGVLRLAEPCGRALPIPVPPAPLGGRCTPPLAPGALPGRWPLRLLGFSLRADGGRLLCAELLLGRGVGVFGRPLEPGLGVGVLRALLIPGELTPSPSSLS
jgi:hypothetical protein